MPTNELTPANSWTHRDYFEQFRLNVEQYGEILVAQAFRGEKKGDAQRCYDVEAKESDVRIGLQQAGGSTTAMYTCLASHSGGVLRIEVKCKLARTASGKASVIHCSKAKLEGVGLHSAATHFAIIIFDQERNGIVKEAWLFTVNTAKQLLREGKKSKCLYVTDIRNAASVGYTLIDIRTLINDVACRPLTKNSLAVGVTCDYKT